MDDKDDGSTNYVKAAFHWQYNWITLAGAAGLAPKGPVLE